jgi:hypothetical protein
LRFAAEKRELFHRARETYSGGLPIKPTITPAWGVGGFILIALGAILTFIVEYHCLRTPMKVRIAPSAININPPTPHAGVIVGLIDLLLTKVKGSNLPLDCIP